ncbi:MAG TPA: hypothetical protein VLT90_11110 [Terriglobales bacterium]|nr:hypothetical protein [Terriglobales bacterium]
MKTKFLVAVVACLSVVAAAQQSDKKKEQPASHEVKSPRDAATGQASGRKMDQSGQQSEQPATARETGSGMATGKKTAQDDWNAQLAHTSGDPHVENVSTGNANGDQSAVRESPSKASLGKTSVATGDVDADGTADKTAASGSVKSPRDAATGQASGKRQHEPVKVVKDTNSAAPQK